MFFVSEKGDLVIVLVLLSFDMNFFCVVDKMYGKLSLYFVVENGYFKVVCFLCEMMCFKFEVILKKNKYGMNYFYLISLGGNFDFFWLFLLLFEKLNCDVIVEIDVNGCIVLWFVV